MARPSPVPKTLRNAEGRVVIVEAGSKGEREFLAAGFIPDEPEAIEHTEGVVAADTQDAEHRPKGKVGKT